MQIILMTSDTVATLNQSHTVVTALIEFQGYDTDAFFTVYVWFAEIKAILTNVCLAVSSRVLLLVCFYVLRFISIDADVVQSTSRHILVVHFKVNICEAYN